MSYELVDKVIKCTNVKGTEKLVLITLCSFADKKTFKCFPSVMNLAKRAGVNEKTIRRSLSSLSGRGIIEVTPRSYNNLKTSSIYKINAKSLESDSVSYRSDIVTYRQDSVSYRSDNLSNSNRAESPLGTGRESYKPTIEPITINQPINQPIEMEVKKNDFILPEGIKKEIWQDFEAMRKKLKASMTDRAKNLIIAKLQTINQDTGQDPNDILDQSIMNCWKGVFPIKDHNQKGKNYGNQRNNNESNLQRTIREQAEQFAAELDGES